MLDEVYAQDDKAREDFERYERQRETRRAQLKTKSGDLDLIYKTHVPQPIPQQQQSAAMDDATAKQWNSWLSTYVARELEANNKETEEVIVEFVCEYVQKHLKSVREEIASLRADMNVQTGVARGEIKELKRNVS